MVIGENMNLQRLVINISQRDSNPRLRSVVQMVGYQLLVSGQQNAIDIANVSGTVLILVLTQNNLTLAGRQRDIK